MKTGCLFFLFLLVFCTVKASEVPNENSKLSNVVFEAGLLCPITKNLAEIYDSQSKNRFVILSENKNQYWLLESENDKEMFLETDEEGVLVLMSEHTKKEKGKILSDQMIKMRKVLGLEKKKK